MLIVKQYHIKYAWLFPIAFFKTPQDLAINQNYDYYRNIANMEQHKIDNNIKKLLAHRKDSTRAFGSSAQEINTKYSNVGLLVIL